MISFLGAVFWGFCFVLFFTSYCYFFHDLKEKEARLYNDIIFLSLCKNHNLPKGPVSCNSVVYTHSCIYATHLYRKTSETLVLFLSCSIGLGKKYLFGMPTGHLGGKQASHPVDVTLVKFCSTEWVGKRGAVLAKSMTNWQEVSYAEMSPFFVHFKKSD